MANRISADAACAFDGMLPPTDSAAFLTHFDFSAIDEMDPSLGKSYMAIVLLFIDCITPFIAIAFRCLAVKLSLCPEVCCAASPVLTPRAYANSKEHR